MKRGIRRRGQRLLESRDGDPLGAARSNVFDTLRVDGVGENGRGGGTVIGNFVSLLRGILDETELNMSKVHFIHRKTEHTKHQGSQTCPLARWTLRQ